MTPPAGLEWGKSGAGSRNPVDLAVSQLKKWDWVDWGALQEPPGSLSPLPIRVEGDAVDGPEVPLHSAKLLLKSQVEEPGRGKI